MVTYRFFIFTFSMLWKNFPKPSCEAYVQPFVTREIQYFELEIFSFNSYVYYLIRGFIASTRAANLLIHAFNLTTCAFNLATRTSSLLPRGFELVTHECELVRRRYNNVTGALVFHEFGINCVYVFLYQATNW